MNKRVSKTKALFIGGATAITLLVGVPALAATTSTHSLTHSGRFMHKGIHPAVIGTVSAIDGSTLTVTTRKGIAYSVDTTNATIEKGFGKNETALALSNITVNDMVAVQGTLNGNSVAATEIQDGVTNYRRGMREGISGMPQSLTNASFGTIASVNGTAFTLSHKTKTGTSTITITTNDTTTYKKNGQADTVSDLAVGQHVVVMGAKDSSGNVADATSVNIMVRTARTVPSNTNQT